MRAIVAIFVASLPMIALAEENCGRLFRTVTRFRGNVRNVEHLATRGGPVLVCDPDPQYAVTVDVVSAPADHAGLRSGQTHVFSVRSPSQKFDAESTVGKTLDLEIQWIECNEVFRQFEEVREIGPQRWVEDYDGYVEVGHSYRSDVVWESDDLQLVKGLIAPHHHGIRGHFENIAAFPKLRNDDATRTIVFEVLAEEIIYRREWSWTTLYTLRIVEVSPK
jgi:hypothetical protein